MKLSKSKKDLAPKMAWVSDVTDNQLRGIGLVEVLGAIGIIVPGLTGIASILTPIAAVGCALVMAGAMALHLRRNEARLTPINIVVFAAAVFVAIGRFSAHAF